MKDIDFDELDKAVNSLMGGIKDSSDQPKPKTLNIATTLKDDEKPEYNKLEQAARRIGSETIISPVENTEILPEGLTGIPGEDVTTIDVTPTVAEQKDPEPAAEPEPEEQTVVVPGRPTQPVSRPRAGRFMDVMHHSSDMKSSTPTVSTASANTSPVSHFSPPAELKSATEETPKQAIVEPEPETVSVPEKVVEPVTAQPADDKVEEIASEPQSSPFLPDAKVEKRPLGGAVEDPFTTETSNNSIDEKPEELASTDTQLTPQTTASTDQLPEELGDSLLAIETNLAEETIAEPASESKADDHHSEPTKQTPQPKGPASIAQQYKEIPSSGDQTNGAIYDVDNYHKTVAHPAKSTSSWIWIIAIIIIVIICGAGATAFYLLGTK